MRSIERLLLGLTRRYFSAKEFAIFGAPNVFYPHRPTRDGKFYDFENTWYRYSNEPLNGV